MRSMCFIVSISACLLAGWRSYVLALLNKYLMAACVTLYYPTSPCIGPDDGHLMAETCCPF